MLTSCGFMQYDLMQYQCAYVLPRLHRTLATISHQSLYRRRHGLDQLQLGQERGYAWTKTQHQVTWPGSRHYKSTVSVLYSTIDLPILWSYIGLHWVTKEWSSAGSYVVGSVLRRIHLAPPFGTASKQLWLPFHAFVSRRLDWTTVIHCRKAAANIPGEHKNVPNFLNIVKRLPMELKQKEIISWKNNKCWIVNNTGYSDTDRFCFNSKQCKVVLCVCRKRKNIRPTVWVKKSPSCGLRFSDIFHKRVRILNQFLHTSYTFLSTLG